MNKLPGLLVLPLLMAMSCNSQQKPLEKSLLWEISGNGLEKSSYLFGTFHAVCNPELPKKVSEAINRTEVVVLEIDMDDLDVSSIDPSMFIMKGNEPLWT